MALNIRKQKLAHGLHSQHKAPQLCSNFCQRSHSQNLKHLHQSFSHQHHDYVLSFRISFSVNSSYKLYSKQLGSVCHLEVVYKIPSLAQKAFYQNQPSSQGGQDLISHSEHFEQESKLYSRQLEMAYLPQEVYKKL